MSALLLPAATSRWNFTTSSWVSDAASFRPSSGLAWRSIFERSVAQLDAFLFGFAAGPSARRGPPARRRSGCALLGTRVAASAARDIAQRCGGFAKYWRAEYKPPVSAAPSARARLAPVGWAHARLQQDWSGFPGEALAKRTDRAFRCQIP